MMFWYIGGILAGFAIGYVIAIAQRRDRATYKKGVNDCRNCKHMDFICSDGLVVCEEMSPILEMPKACAKYRRTESTEGDS